MTRFRFLALAAAFSLAALTANAADAPTPLTERSIGSATAPVTVTEYYSLTCSHCARFAADVFPKIKTDLIDTGKLRYVFADFPLDKPALLAAQVARSLPPDRYEPFVLALLGSQRRWAYSADADPNAQLARMASLAGLSRAQFDAAAANTALRDAILAGVDSATKQFGVDSTPTFIFNGPKTHNRKEAGELSFDEFSAAVTDVAGP